MRWGFNGLNHYPWLELCAWVFTFSLYVSQAMRLAVVCKDGQLHLFEHFLNGWVPISLSVNSLKQFGEAHVHIYIYIFSPQDMQEATVASVFPAGVHYEGRLACPCASSRCSSVCGQTKPDAGVRKLPAASHGDNCKYLRNWSLILVGYSVGQISNMPSLLTAI